MSQLKQRHQRARNTNNHYRRDNQQNITWKKQILETICTKHRVGNNLVFKECKFATPDGLVTFIDLQEIRSNMRCGAMIIEAVSLDPTDLPYDLVKMMNDKKTRDELKRHQDLAKIKLEQERLQLNEQKTSIISASEQTVNEVTDTVLPSEAALTDPQTVNSADTKSPSEAVLTDPQVVGGETDHANIETANEEPNPIRPLSKKRRKALNAIKNMNNQLEKKQNRATTIKGNKFFRNFMKDLQSKFQTEPLTQYRYLEVKADATMMVIDNVKLFRIVMPTNTRYHYLLAIGDLQLKSGLMRQIDPAYHTDQATNDYTDFLVDQSKENAQIDVVDDDDCMEGERLIDPDEIGDAV